jgi:hypothetical protein
VGRVEKECALNREMVMAVTKMTQRVQSVQSLNVMKNICFLIAQIIPTAGHALPGIFKIVIEIILLVQEKKQLF